MSKIDSNISDTKKKLSTIEASLTEAHSKADIDDKEKIESAMEAALMATQALSKL